MRTTSDLASELNIHSANHLQASPAHLLGTSACGGPKGTPGACGDGREGQKETQGAALPNVFAQAQDCRWSCWSGSKDMLLKLYAFQIWHAPRLAHKLHIGSPNHAQIEKPFPCSVEYHGSICSSQVQTKDNNCICIILVFIN